MTVTLDLMDLTDVGGQPRKLAAEIHRQLRAQFGGEVPLPVPLRDIAAAAGIEEIIERETDSYVGMLVTKADRSSGIIVLQAGLRRGRANFTIGHEIGHFVNPYHKPPPDGFVCTPMGMGARRAGNIAWEQRSPADRMEVEANEFSIALSVPVPEYRREREAMKGCDINHLGALRETFGLSVEALSQVYVDTAPEKIAILFSKDGQVTRFVIPKGFPFLGLSRGQPLPSRSVTSRTRKALAPGTSTRIEEVAPDTWLDRSTKQVTLHEQVLAQSGDRAVTMLLLGEPEEDEQEEDEAIERLWYRPQFGYR